MRAQPIAIDWNPDLPIFAKESFLASVGDEYGWLGGLDDSEKLRCVLPYTIVRKATVRMVRFRVETILLDENLCVEDERRFLDSAMAHFKKMGADIVIPATTNSIFRTYPTGATAAPYGTLIIDLDRDEETLFNNMSTSHRRKVRLASKAGIHIATGHEHAGLAYEMVRDTFKRSSLPFMERSPFMRMIDGLRDNVLIMIAEHAGVVQGCVVDDRSSPDGNCDFFGGQGFNQQAVKDSLAGVIGKVKYPAGFIDFLFQGRDVVFGERLMEHAPHAFL